ncbi:DUF4091 domain-containing protein, partial [bacterium]|nr:DUF4091 domain-containing protein [bacterium]
IPQPQIRYVGFVPKRFSEEYIKRYNLNPKLYFEHQPDPLFWNKPEIIEKNKTQPIWLTYYIPENTPAGIYRGEIYVKAGNISKKIPVEIAVRNFSLPEHNPLKFYGFYRPEQLFQYLDCKDDEEWFLALSRVAKEYSQHGMNVGRHIPQEIKWVIQPDGYITFDYTLFDRVWKMYQEAGMGNYQIVFPNIKPHIAQLWNGKKVKVNFTSVNVKDARERVLSDLSSHLERNGWKDKAVVYVIDEPRDYDIAAKHCAPYNRVGIKTMAALNNLYLQGLKKIEGKLNIWVPNYLGYGVPEVFEYFTELLKKGEEIWWYECSSGAPDTKLNADLMDIRYMVWTTFKYKLKGMAMWGGGNCWGTIGVPPNLKIGTNWVYDPYTFTSEGLNFIVYPDYKRKSIISSIRFENLRDSFQDYMYLWILKNEIEKAKKKEKTS